jgi:3-hydroxyacyl-[acyl-carrier-protein] dehydratase
VSDGSSEGKKSGTEMRKHLSEIKGIFFFDPKDRIYQDHFPGNSIVPGSVIVHSFFSASEQAGLLAHGLLIEKFRFKKFVTPGEYPYRIQVNKDNLICELYEGKQVVVKGNLKR